MGDRQSHTRSNPNQQANRESFDSPKTSVPILMRRSTSDSASQAPSTASRHSSDLSSGYLSPRRLDRWISHESTGSALSESSANGSPTSLGGDENHEVVSMPDLTGESGDDVNADPNVTTDIPDDRDRDVQVPLPIIVAPLDHHNPVDNLAVYRHEDSSPANFSTSSNGSHVDDNNFRRRLLYDKVKYENNEAVLSGLKAKATNFNDLHLEIKACSHITQFTFVETDQQFEYVDDFINPSGRTIREKVLVNCEEYGELDARNVVRSVLRALCWSHKNGLMFGKLTPDSLLYSDTSDDFDAVKLDMSDCIFTGSNGFLVSPELSISYYLSPEVREGRDFDLKADIWFVGVLAYTLLTGPPPLVNDDPDPLSFNVNGGDSARWQGISDEAKAFVTYLVRPTAADRPTAVAALDHHWFLATSEYRIPENVLETFQQWDY